MSESPSLWSTSPQLFDRKRVRLHRHRAASGFADHSFLKTRAVEDLIGRLDQTDRYFDRILDLGTHTGQAGQAARAWANPGALIVHSDLSLAYAERAPSVAIVADEECLPFANNSFDLVISCLSLHWVNDLAGCLTGIRSLVRPGGLFIGAMIGGDTLTELRQCLVAAENQHRPDSLPIRISPMIRVPDLAALLVHCGFGRPVADRWSVNVQYDDPRDLLYDLRGMGETAAPYARVPALTRPVLSGAMNLYRRDFPDSSARFDIITATGWAV